MNIDEKIQHKDKIQNKKYILIALEISPNAQILLEGISEVSSN